MSKLSSWYNKKLTESQLETWYDRVGHVPNEAFRDIVSYAIDTQRYFPSPQWFVDQWNEWRRLNPQRIASQQEPEVWCDECEGDGCIRAWRKGQKPFLVNGKPKDSWYMMFLPCAECRNWRREFPTVGSDRPKKFWTKAQVLERGWKLKDPDFEQKSERKAIRSATVEELAESVTKRVPERQGLIFDDDIPF
jgi:hypothetical protein